MALRWFPATWSTTLLLWSIERSCQAAGHLTSTCFWHTNVCKLEIGQWSWLFFVFFKHIIIFSILMIVQNIDIIDMNQYTKQNIVPLFFFFFFFKCILPGDLVWYEHRVVRKFKHANTYRSMPYDVGNTIDTRQPAYKKQTIFCFFTTTHALYLCFSVLPVSYSHGDWRLKILKNNTLIYFLLLHLDRINNLSSKCRSVKQTLNYLPAR